jgi:hypothetical protein
MIGCEYKSLISFVIEFYSYAKAGEIFNAFGTYLEKL